MKAQSMVVSPFLYTLILSKTNFLTTIQKRGEEKKKDVGKGKGRVGDKKKKVQYHQPTLPVFSLQSGYTHNEKTHISEM